MSDPDHFKKGTEVEVSSNDNGFRGAWYAGTVVKSKNNKRSMVVEYKTLMADESGTKPLRETLDVVQLRPLPPREKRQVDFKFSDEVDAYYNDGWWEGVITGVVPGDRYSVFFRATREQLEFSRTELRLHREWVYGKWVPPLQEEQEDEELEWNMTMHFIGRIEMEFLKRIGISIFVRGKDGGGTRDDDVSMILLVEGVVGGGGRCDVDSSGLVATISTELKLPNKDKLTKGSVVEVCSDEDGFQGAWFAATITEQLPTGNFLVKYKSLRNDEDTEFLTETVDINHIRPKPSDEVVDGFHLLEEVDALYNDGWWVGVISKVLARQRYKVYFRGTSEEMVFKQSDLRRHLDWILGKWVSSSSSVCTSMRRTPGLPYRPWMRLH
ncbi:hypothetical protein OSB04_010876 [Centaurea solstitialis]|uniref:Agenet domain-containing protein n=1 Tax=Centaurea solstitialis TaxID=347529 RepID=A0AA38WD74_9ASTR|nr:hypothetical protein OSB04_010876 [Centaurea solstitialis]